MIWKSAVDVSQLCFVAKRYILQQKCEEMNRKFHPRNTVVQLSTHTHGPPTAGVWRTKLQSTWASTVLRLLPSAADIYDQPTSISWLYRVVGGLHSAIGLSLWQSRRSGTHYRL